MHRRIPIRRIDNLKSAARRWQLLPTFTTASGLLPAGMPFTSGGSRTEFAWKYDIKLGCKALRLKVEQADPIDNVHLGKMAVVVASIQNKACGRGKRLFSEV